MKKTTDNRGRQLQIGNVVLENNVILAPMAGVTDLPFRLICKEQGAGLLCMEMISAKAVHYNNKNRIRAGYYGRNGSTHIRTSVCDS